jgi:hypothetical protein
MSGVAGATFRIKPGESIVVIELRRTTVRRCAIAAVVAGLALFAMFGGLRLPHAAAAAIDGAITNVQVSPPSAGPHDPMRVDVQWAVPDSAGSGDTFTLTLPPELTALTASFDLKAPDGSVVATAKVVNGLVTFTLTDYADSHDRLHGTAFFSVKWDLSTTPTSGPVRLDFTTPTRVFHDTVIKTPGTGTGTVDRTVPRKAGHWVTNGVTAGADALAWVIDSPSGPFDQATFDDSVGPGQAIDCGTVEYQLGSGLDPTGHASMFRTLPANKVLSRSCTATGLKLTAGPILADQIIRIRYSVDVTDPTLTAYQNSVDVTVGATRYGSVTDRVRVHEAGGDGSGTVSPTSTSTTRSPTTTATVLPTKLTTSPTITAAGLPFTGANVRPMVVLAGLLVGGGALATFAGRGPRTNRKH